MNTATLLGSIFSPGELAIIITLAVLGLLLLVGNIVLYYLLRRRQEHKLCTTRLQAKRNELLDHLKNISDDGSLIAGGAIYSDAEEEEEEEVEESEEEDEDEDENGPAVTTEAIGEGEDITQYDILAVADMSDYTRRKLDCVGEEYDNKRYYVRYKFGFEAKLRAASDEVKERYIEFVNELFLYQGIKIKSSFRGQRFYKGRKTLGQIFMRGKTLCVAFALDPAEYAETKYHGVDISDKKRYEKTPMMYKLTSMRRVEYSRYLIMQLAEKNMITPEEGEVEKLVSLASYTPDELFVMQALRIVILGEAPELEVEDEPEIIVEEPEQIAVAQSEEVLEEEREEGEDGEEDSDEQDDMGIDTPEGRIVFDRSFTARITQANDVLKARYSELKNYILEGKNVRSRTSWKRETFSLGRQTLATFAVRGKTLMLYLATDPGKYDYTKYKVENMSEVASRRKTPLLFRVKSDRRTAYAKQLIDMLFDEVGIARVERKPQDYRLPYKTTDDLINRGLIKLVATQRGFGFKPETKPEEKAEAAPDTTPEETVAVASEPTTDEK